MSTISESTTTFFVIADKDTAQLVTSTFSAGPDEDEQAVLVFTERGKARTYLQTAEWLQSETVAELQPAAFVRWLLASRDHGVELAVIDPDRIHQQDGILQTVVSIDHLLTSLGPAILNALKATDFEERR